MGLSRTFLGFILLFGLSFGAKFCSKPPFKQDVKEYKGNTRRNLQVEDRENIRIAYDFAGILNGTQEEAYKSEWISILEEAKSNFEAILKVNRLVDPVVYDDTRPDFHHCNLAVFDQEQASGVEADLVIFAYFDSTTSQDTLAYASVCAIEQDTSRPVIGLIGINPKEFNKLDYRNAYTTTILHEITHVLGFNPVLFSHFRNSENEKYDIGVLIEGKYYITSPKAVEKAREHFNCPTLSRLPLEDDGGDGTAIGHWEYRHFVGEYMAGVDQLDAAVSDITLGLLEDSGWYSVEYFTGGLHVAGKGEGCAFFDSKCVEDEKSAFPETYCSEGGELYCTANNNSRGVCLLQSGEQPREINYYEDLTKGGLEIAEHCPVPINFVVSVNDSYVDMGSCLRETGLVQNSTEPAENKGESSKCFINTLGNAVKPTSKCFEVECREGEYSVTVGGIKFNCQRGGSDVEIPGLEGKLTCGRIEQVCPSTVPCSSFKDCIEKKSQAKFYPPPPEPEPTVVKPETNTNNEEPTNINDTSSEKPADLNNSNTEKSNNSDFLGQPKPNEEPSQPNNDQNEPVEQPSQPETPKEEQPKEEAKKPESSNSQPEAPKEASSEEQTKQPEDSSNTEREESISNTNEDSAEATSLFLTCSLTIIFVLLN